MGSLQKGNELCGIYSPQLRDELVAGGDLGRLARLAVDSTSFIGIKKAVSWGT